MITSELHQHNGIVGLLKSHIRTLESMGMDDDHDFVRGMKRAVEIIEESSPKIVWRNDAK